MDCSGMKSFDIGPETYLIYSNSQQSMKPYIPTFIAAPFLLIFALINHFKSASKVDAKIV